MDSLPDERPEDQDPSRLIRFVARLRRAPAARKQAYALGAAAVCTLLFVAAALAWNYARNRDEDSGQLAAGLRQLVELVGGVLWPGAAPENSL